MGEILKLIETFGLSVVLVVFYLFKILPDERKRSKEREDRYEKLLQQTIRDSFEGINDTLQLILQAIHDEKEFSIEQKKLILKTSIKITVFKIYFDIATIIDNNNLIENEDSIIQDIKNILDLHVDSGRDLFKLFGVSPQSAMEIAKFTDELKVCAYNKISALFVATNYNLLAINEGLKEIEKNIFFKQMQDNIQTFFRSYIEKRNKKDDDYNRLKRNLRNITNEIEIKISNFLNEGGVL